MNGKLITKMSCITAPIEANWRHNWEV